MASCSKSGLMIVLQRNAGYLCHSERQTSYVQKHRAIKDPSIGATGWNVQSTTELLLKCHGCFFAKNVESL
jgi:hypothetical protein